MNAAFSPADLARMQQGAADAAALLRVLAHEQRLLVLCQLVAHGERAVGELQAGVDLGQSALSQHLARMREEGLVATRREGQHVHYRIADPRVASLIGALKSVFCP
jgi:DNA-binding transcriptional ArsR family regulator